MSDQSARVVRASVRARTGWRVLLGVYAAIVSVGTHWPRLQLGDPRHPPDKLLHFVAFGGLAFLLWQARYFKRVRSLFVFGVLWTATDEVTQAIPGLGRSFSVDDILAGSLGVWSATMLIWATKPAGGPMTRLRRERFDGVLDLVLSKPSAWLAFLTAGAAGSLIGMVVAVFINGYGDDPSPFMAAITGMVLGAAATGPAMLLHGVRVVDERMLRGRLCLGCGESFGDVDGHCRVCGERSVPGQWFPVPWLSRRDVVRACVPPLLGAIGSILLLLILYWGAATFWPNLDRWARGRESPMREAFGAVFLATLVALTLHRCRARLGRRIELGSVQCLGCGQDLRATPTTNGVGRCSECGAGFVRGEMQNP
ncbi:MAG: VanZ family protein [Phycisphaerae bacterium]|nr:VanZ family protein [Phycisphaerae bacterium]